MQLRAHAALSLNVRREMVRSVVEDGLSVRDAPRARQRQELGELLRWGDLPRCGRYSMNHVRAPGWWPTA